MRLLFDRDYDADGAIAAGGSIDRAWIDGIIEGEPYFERSAPKSTGRELFGEQRGRALAEEGSARGLDAPSVIASLTALTAVTVARAARAVAGGVPIDELIVGGGGAHTRTMMRLLSEELAPTRVCSGDEVGIPADAKEAICFAILANEALCGTPANVPSVTGAREHVVCGAIRLPPVGPV
jgi:anhydro-N-acetylmuramic acid kinase